MKLILMTTLATFVILSLAALLAWVFMTWPLVIITLAVFVAFWSMVYYWLEDYY